MGQLEDYIRQLQQQGYTTEQIRASLTQSGYQPAVIDAVFSEMAKPAVVAVPTRRPLLPIVALSIFLLTFIAVIYLFVFASEITVTLDLVKPTQLEFFQGDTISFERLLETETKKKVDVMLSHQLVEQKTGKFALQKTENIALLKKNTGTVRFPTREDTKPGAYVVKSLAKYDEKQAEEEFEVRIKEKKLPVTVPAPEIVFEAPAEVVVDCPKGCDDLNACTSDACVEGKCAFTPITPCCGNGQCEQGENGLTCVKDCAARVETPADVENKAQTAATTDPTLAVSLCSSITQPAKADECVYGIARKTNQSQTCSTISEERTRDACFMDFALANDFTVCDHVTNTFLQNSCYSLERLKSQQAQVAALQAQMQTPAETLGA